MAVGSICMQTESAGGRLRFPRSFALCCSFILKDDLPCLKKSASQKNKILVVWSKERKCSFGVKTLTIHYAYLCPNSGASQEADFLMASTGCASDVCYKSHPSGTVVSQVRVCACGLSSNRAGNEWREGPIKRAPPRCWLPLLLAAPQHSLAPAFPCPLPLQPCGALVNPSKRPRNPKGT